MLKFLVAGLVVVCFGFADEIQFGGITTGFVFDSSSSSIRSILGVSGAATLGGAVVRDIELAEIAPDGDRAVASKGGRLYVLSGLRRASPSWIPISAISKVDQIVWNSASSAAALYSTEAGALVLIRLQGDGSLEEFSLDLAGVGAAIGPILVDSEGRYVVVMTASEPADLYVLDRQAGPKRVAQLDWSGPMTFAGKERDVLAADVSRRQIVQIQDVFGAATVLPFGALPADLETPVGMAVSQDDTHAFVVDKASKRIVVYETGTRNLVDQISLDTEAAFAKRFSRDSLFLLNSSASGSEPWEFLDTGDKPSVFFVPAGGYLQ